MEINKKTLNKKLKELTVREFIGLGKETKRIKGNYFENVTEECTFKPFCTGGSNNNAHGADDTYYHLGIYYGDTLIFKLDVNSFKEQSIMPQIFSETDRDFKFHWLDNGSFMIVMKLH